MGLFDKFLDAVRLNDDYDEDEDEFFDEDDDDYEEEEQPKKRFFSKLSKARDEEEEEEDFPVRKSEPKQVQTPKYTAAPRQTKPVAPAAKVTPMRRASKNSSMGSMEVCVIKPTKVEDYREIADTLLSNCTVVLNLEGLDVELAQRIIDFSSGSCYAINGGLQKVSSYIFILTPSNVEISGDIQDLLNGAIPSMRTSF
ncbi:MAG: cell division protein SepF [Eubacterium sp.]|nr:cell division protein SepF [Eubacterium sp.]